MSTSRRLILPAILALLGATLSWDATANAQDLADRKLDLAIRRTALWEYWAARQQEQIDWAHHRPYAQYGQYGLRYPAQPSVGYRAVGPRQFYGSSLSTSSGYSSRGLNTCIGPLGIECNPLDCDCDPLDSCY